MARKAKEQLENKLPSLKILGECNGYFDQEKEKQVIAEINACQPDILVVGMGSPKQENWIYHNRNALNASLCWQVGALFDSVSGEMKRAPQWALDHHLEWLYRLCREPKRLWRRYTIEIFIFVYKVLTFRISALINTKLKKSDKLSA